MTLDARALGDRQGRGQGAARAEPLRIPRRHDHARAHLRDRLGVAVRLHAQRLGADQHAEHGIRRQRVARGPRLQDVSLHGSCLRLRRQRWTVPAGPNPLDTPPSTLTGAAALRRRRTRRRPLQRRRPQQRRRPRSAYRQRRARQWDRPRRIFSPSRPAARPRRRLRLSDRTASTGHRFASGSGHARSSDRSRVSRGRRADRRPGRRLDRRPRPCTVGAPGASRVAGTVWIACSWHAYHVGAGWAAASCATHEAAAVPG